VRTVMMRRGILAYAPAPLPSGFRAAHKKAAEIRGFFAFTSPHSKGLS
jgi:hypothetical protein